MNSANKISLYEVRLDKNLGYGYAIFINHVNETGYSTIIVKVLDKIDKFRITIESIEALLKEDQIVCDLLFLDWPSHKSYKDNWFHLCDLKFYDYKLLHQKSIVSINTASDFYFKSCYYNQFFSDKSFEIDFKYVQHLPDDGICTCYWGRTKITLYWLKKLGIPFESKYSQEELLSNSDYVNEVNNCVFYDRVPKEIRGKALVKGNVDDKYLDIFERRS